MDLSFNNHLTSHHRAGLFRLFLYLNLGLLLGCQSSNPQHATIRYDYYPSKITLDYAQGFSVSYHKSFKRVKVFQEADRNQVLATYLLVEHGTQVPEHHPEDIIIRIPLTNLSCISTTHIPFVRTLGQLSKVVGVGHSERLHDSILLRQIERSWTLNITTAGQPDPEKILESNTRVLCAYPFDYQSLSELEFLNIPVIYVAEYTENSLLARAEWIKFFALFFNEETQANQWFANLINTYEKARQSVEGRSNRAQPRVFFGSHYQGTWFAPDAHSLMAQLINDAGGRYFTQQTNQGHNLSLELEVLVKEIPKIEFWGELFYQDQKIIISDFMAGDSRLLASAKNDNVSYFAVDTHKNDYFGQALLEPDILLQDLAKILHPDLFPSHQFVYFEPITADD